MNAPQKIAFALCALSLAACSKSRDSSSDLDSTQIGVVMSAANKSVNEAQSAASFAFAKMMEKSRMNQLSLDALVEPFTATTIDTTANCDAGGTVSLSGSMSHSTTTVDAHTERFTFSYEMDETFNDCKGTGSDGVTYTLGGNLSVNNASGTIEANDSDHSFAIDFTLPLIGTISLSGGDVDVSDCTIDLTSTVTADITVASTHALAASSTYSSSWSGSVCGKTVEGSSSN